MKKICARRRSSSRPPVHRIRTRSRIGGCSGKFDNAWVSLGLRSRHSGERSSAIRTRSMVAEYVAVCLDRAEGAEALRMATRACQLRPGDAGLQSNLAVVQLIARQVDEAMKTVQGALRADPTDKITQALETRIAAARDGRHPVPKTPAEFEGRGRVAS